MHGHAVDLQVNVGMKMLRKNILAPIFMPKAIPHQSTDYRFATPISKSIT
jgi:hypothetical protein